MLTTFLTRLRVAGFGKHNFELFEHLFDLNLVRIAEVEYRLTELVSHLLQQVQVEMVVCKLALVRSAETSL